jgi:uncharacterized damage-inducible protein DinB
LRAGLWKNIIAFSSPFYAGIGYAVWATWRLPMDYQKDLIAEYGRETAKTRKMLDALPEDADFDFKPHPKSLSLGKLAGHLTDMTGEWALNTLTKDKMDLPADYKWVAFVPASKAELLEKFDKDLPAVLEAIAAVPMDKWDTNWQFIFGGHAWIDEPRKTVFREIVISHMVHHRAQLGVYIRLIGGKIPGMYGPSGDEM